MWLEVSAEEFPEVIKGKGSEDLRSIILQGPGNQIVFAGPRADLVSIFQRAIDALAEPTEESFLCRQGGPGEAKCELRTDHPGAHQLRSWGPQGALGTMYWEFDPEEGILASWKPERGAYESEDEFEERKSRYQEAGV